MSALFGPKRIAATSESSSRTSMRHSSTSMPSLANWTRNELAYRVPSLRKASVNDVRHQQCRGSSVPGEFIGQFPRIGQLLNGSNCSRMRLARQ